MRRQLTSPASWLIVGVFALLASSAFVTTLNAFLNRSSQALSVPPPQPINVDQLLIRPFPPRRMRCRPFVKSVDELCGLTDAARTVVDDDHHAYHTIPADYRTIPEDHHVIPRITASLLRITGSFRRVTGLFPRLTEPFPRMTALFRMMIEPFPLWIAPFPGNQTIPGNDRGIAASFGPIRRFSGRL